MFEGCKLPSIEVVDFSWIGTKVDAMVKTINQISG